MRAWKTVASIPIAALSVITIAVAASASPWTGLGNTAETVIYLGSAGPTALDPPGRLVTTMPAVVRANTTMTGRKAGWFELRAGGSKSGTGPFGSAPSPSGFGYMWPDTSLEGDMISAGDWSPTITLRSVGTVRLVPVVRYFKWSSGGRSYALIGSSTGSTRTLGSTEQTLTLPVFTGGDIRFNPGERLYVDLLAKVKYSCCTAAAVIHLDNGGARQSLTIPPVQVPPAPVPPTTQTPASPVASPTAAPDPSTSASTSTATYPAPTATAPTSTNAPSTVATVWQPKPGTSWQWQITGVVDPSLPVQMYDIDLFDAQAPSSYSVPGVGVVIVPRGDNAGIIDRLHAANKKVVCYLDTGAWESYRPDASLFPSPAIGNTTGWSGERWLDIRHAAWPQFESLIAARLDLAARSGCDGVEPDQNNPLGNNPGFAISQADQKSWYLEVARLAHVRNLSVGQKNGIETTDADTVAAFDWNLNEECNMYSECDALQLFIAANKAVFQVEYVDEGMTTSAFCAQDNAKGFDGLLKQLELGTWRQACR